MVETSALETIFEKIKDPACRLVAQHALKASRRSLDIRKDKRLSYISEEISKIMLKALKIRGN